MKNNIRIAICSVISVLLSFSFIFGQKLDDELLLLAPLTNKNWEGKMPRFGEGAKRLVRWEVIWDGKAVRQITEIKKINFITETYYFWDPDQQEIGLFSLSSNGSFLRGHVKEDQGKILMYGMATYPESRLKFKNTFELTEDGKLIDRWFTFQEGEWKPGHTFELSENKLERPRPK